TPVNGVYTIDKVTDDIEVTTIIDKDTLDEVVKSKFTVDASNNITFSAGDTLAKFMDDTKIVESMISLKSVNEKLRRDEVLRDGYVLSIIDDAGETIVRYTVKIDGTISEYTPDDAKIDQINNYISDTITKSGTGITADNLKNSLLNDGNRSAVANVIKKAMKGEKVTIVAFGGSITWGAGESSVPSSITHSFSGNENYVKLVGDWFKSVFSDNVTIKNAGIGATDTPYAIHRMNMDVMRFDPDLVIVEWDKNDVNKDTYKQATYENMLRKFISKGVAVVMFGMCGSNTNGDDSSIEMHVPLAEQYDLPYISYRDAFGNKADSYKSELLTKLTNDYVHPNIVGHQLAALLLNNYFGNIYKNIDSIGSYEPVMPKKPYNAEATVFGEGRVVDLDDVADGKVKGIKIVDLGSFVKDTTLDRVGRDDIRENHERYA
ncbi:MAG: SGNH/GDSL hydrolase family protein, partial [Acutalibacteraceae bacterium]|nr:SGNH/GDSL hydrolase family protein [Acutalibacteraceae bacterium]